MRCLGLSGHFLSTFSGFRFGALVYPIVSALNVLSLSVVLDTDNTHSLDMCFFRAFEPSGKIYTRQIKSEIPSRR